MAFLRAAYAVNRSDLRRGHARERSVRLAAMGLNILLTQVWHLSMAGSIWSS